MDDQTSNNLLSNDPLSDVSSLNPPRPRWDPARSRKRPPLHPSAVFAGSPLGEATKIPGHGDGTGENPHGPGGAPGVAPVMGALFGAMAAQPMSQAALARAAGLHRRCLEEWRAGRSAPTLASLCAVLAVLGLRVVVVRGAPDA
jgi:DNA-binding XRE family transcriptional regulator